MFIRYNEIAKYWEYDSATTKDGKGPWIKLPIDISQIVGILPPAQLPPNIAFTNISNNFSQAQFISHADPQLFFHETDGTVDARRWRMIGFSGNLYFQPVNDSNAPTAQSILLSRNGDIYTDGQIKAGGGIIDFGRTVPMGVSQVYTPTLSASGVTFTSPGTNTVYYTLVGRTVYLNFYFTSITVTSTGFGEIIFNLPFAAGTSILQGTRIMYNNGSVWTDMVGYIVPGESQYRLQNSYVPAGLAFIGSAFYFV